MAHPRHCNKKKEVIPMPRDMDFLHGFGDPPRYSQGSPPSILTNWKVSTTGNKQIGGSHHLS